MAALAKPRLVLRPLVASDAAPYAAMRWHPEVARWLVGAPDDPQDAARSAIAAFAALWEKDGLAPWGVFDKAPDGREGKLVGQGGLRRLPETDAVEVLYALHPDVWGRGLAVELGRESLRFGFDSRGLDRIFAITRPDNLASQAVLRRLGLGERRRTVWRGLDVVWFDIDAASSRAHDAAASAGDRR